MDTITAEGGSSDLSRLRLFRLLSPMLPIGSFSWSQGLETAVDRAWIYDAPSALEWMRAQLLFTLAPTEGAYLIRLHKALEEEREDDFLKWNDQVLATRETKELWEEDLEQGELLSRVNQLHYPQRPKRNLRWSLVAAFAEALVAAGIDRRSGLEGFFWMWCEGQVIQAIKLIPLGLKAGQDLLDQLMAEVPTALKLATECPDDQLGLSLLGRSLLSSWHETQYSRIYRS